MLRGPIEGAVLAGRNVLSTAAPEAAQAFKTEAASGERTCDPAILGQLDDRPAVAPLQSDPVLNTDHVCFAATAAGVLQDIAHALDVALLDTVLAKLAYHGTLAGLVIE